MTARLLLGSGRPPQRSRRLAVALVPAVLTALIAASPAAAGPSHSYVGTYGAASSTPANQYPISEPTDVDIDQASHDIYVTDPPHHRVEKLDSSGHFILMFGKDVNQTTGGDVCPEGPADVCQTGTVSTNSGGFESPSFIAVDNTGGPSTGDVYVGDGGSHLVQKFDSSGHIIKSWGVSGQKDGSDATDLPVYGPLYGLAVGGPEDNMYVGGTHYSYNVWKYTQDGTYLPRYRGTRGIPWLKADPQGDLFYTGNEGFFGPPVVSEEVPIPNTSEYTEFQMGTATPVTGFGFDPSGPELYQDTGEQIAHYSVDCEPPQNGPCDPIDTFGNLAQLQGGNAVAVDAASHTVLVSNSMGSDIVVYGDARPVVTTGSPTGVTETSVTLNGNVDPAGRGNVSQCRFEYGPDKTYGQSVPCTPDASSSNFTGPTAVATTITGLAPGTKEHYRVVAANANGVPTSGRDRVFITTSPPAIDGLTAENLTATTAELIAQVNPDGLETEYQFEYGLTPDYGQVEPATPSTVAASYEDQEVTVQLTNLTPHTVYHFRITATNTAGTTTSVDSTFSFYPPSCPNENVRQQVKANYLPDCRAYELVSPGDAGGTQLYPGGPNTGLATDPSRLAFVGLWATIPNSGGSPADTVGDLYVATRTATGWVTKYVGPPSNEVAVAGGPPMGLPGQGGAQFLGNDSSISNGFSGADRIQNNVLTDPSMDTFLDFSDGSQEPGGANYTPIGSNAPYVWNAEGKALDRWPTNLNTVPPGKYPDGSYIYDHPGYIGEGDQPATISPGSSHALDCPAVQEYPSQSLVNNNCPGDVNASSDLSHFVFSTEWNVFAPGGQLNAPGSVYDNDTGAGTVVVASKTPAGDDIPSEPGDLTGDSLELPGVSSNGSHVLMAASGTGPCGVASCPIPPCHNTFGGVVPCPTYPGHLYMRVDGAVTYDVSKGHDVSYAGMNASGSKVYFVSPDQLTTDDQDSSSDLYMWSQGTDSLTLVSKGDNPGNFGEPGNSNACQTKFVANCGVTTYSNLDLCQLTGNQGGNCRSDNSVAANNGDIYFFSPEQLDGFHGIPNKENMYVYREGKAQFVATMEPKPFCYTTPVEGVTDEACSNGPVARMQVSPDDSHMAFATSSQITQYDNKGHLEMYTYDPGTGKVVCASCIPSGAPPTSDIGASQSGLFMANDGRVFFTTNDALVHSDTNQALDVYEYVDGRPQLITTGTGETRLAGGFAATLLNPPGLLGVSADGTDVYFSTYDTLVKEDHNGLFLKMYDARSGGGFPAPALAPPCSAADECHGPGSSPPEPLRNGTGVPLGSNKSAAKKRHRKHHRKHSRRRHRHAGTGASGRAGR